MLYTSKLCKSISVAGSPSLQQTRVDRRDVQENKSRSERTSQQERKVAGNTATRGSIGGTVDRRKSERYTRIESES